MIGINSKSVVTVNQSGSCPEDISSSLIPYKMQRKLFLENFYFDLFLFLFLPLFVVIYVDASGGESSYCICIEISSEGFAEKVPTNFYWHPHRSDKVIVCFIIWATIHSL